MHDVTDIELEHLLVGVIQHPAEAGVHEQHLAIRPTHHDAFQRLFHQLSITTFALVPGLFDALARTDVVADDLDGTIGKAVSADLHWDWVSVLMAHDALDAQGLERLECIDERSSARIRGMDELVRDALQELLARVSQHPACGIVYVQHAACDVAQPDTVRRLFY